MTTTELIRPGAPPTPRARVAGLDVARFLALAGMVVAHLCPPVGYTGVLVDGLPSALFAALAGVSMVFLTPGRLVVRGAILIALHWALTPIAGVIDVVLLAMGLSFLAAAVFVRRSTVTVAAGAAAAAGLSWVIAALQDAAVPLPAVLGAPYPLFAWLCFQLAGLCAGRLLLNNPRRAARVLAVAAPLAAAGIAARLLVNPDTDPVGLSAHSGGLGDIAVSLAASATVLCACLVAVRGTGGALRPLAAAGAMPLTLYVAHIATAGPLVTSDLSTYEHPVALAATLLGFVAFAAAWRHFFNRGPLEAALAATSRTLAPGPARTQKDKD
ncbi:DUF418 domain-containing protein [Corynebacterium otitidis]